MTSTKLKISSHTCAKKLRSLEHIAYSDVVSSLRAQGSLTKDKRKLLHDLQIALHIPMSLHKCEIRRAVNSAYLYTIATRLEGPNTARDWAIEGRSLCAPVPRAPVENEYTQLATRIVEKYKAQCAKRLAAAKLKKKKKAAAKRAKSKRSNSASVQKDEEVIELDKQDNVKPGVSEGHSSKDIGRPKKGKKRKASDPKVIDKRPRKVVVIDDPSAEGPSRQGVSRKMLKSSSASSSSTNSVVALKKLKSCVHTHKRRSKKTAALPTLANLPFSSQLRKSSLITTSSAQSRVTRVNPSKSPLFKTVIAPSALSSPQSYLSRVNVERNTALGTVTTQSATSSVQSCMSWMHPFKTLALKTVTAPSAAPIPNQHGTAGSALAITAKSNVLQNSSILGSTSSNASASVVNSLTTPLLSVSAGQDLTTKASAHVMKSKVSSPAKRLVRPRLSRSNISISSPALLNMSSTSQHSAQSPANTSNKTVLSLKSHPPSSVSSTSPNSVQITSESGIFKRPTSPITLLPKIRATVTIPSKMKTPVTLKYCQTKQSDSAAKESVLSGLPKGFTKSTVTVPALATKSASESRVPMVRASDLISNWKTANSPKVLPAAKVSSSLNMPQKLLTTHIAASAPVCKRFQFGSDRGLKIISPSSSNNPMLSKPGASSGTGITTITNTVTTATPTSELAKNTKFVNLTPHPIKLDRRRIHLLSPPTSASTIVSTAGVRGCSSPGVSTSNSRPTLPAKPNVIVVHKAQVLPQTSGTAIVMPSSSSSTNTLPVPLDQIKKEFPEDVLSKKSRHVSFAEKPKVISVHPPKTPIIVKKEPADSGSIKESLRHIHFAEKRNVVSVQSTVAPIVVKEPLDVHTTKENRKQINIAEKTMFTVPQAVTPIVLKKDASIKKDRHVTFAEKPKVFSVQSSKSPIIVKKDDSVRNKDSGKLVNFLEKPKLFSFEQSMVSTVSRASSFPSTAGNTSTTPTTEQPSPIPKAKNSEHSVDEKIRLVQATSLIQRKNSGKIFTSSLHDKTKFSVNKQPVSCSSINTSCSNKIVANLSKETVATNKINIEPNLQQNKPSYSKESDSLVRIASGTDNYGSKKRLRISAPIDEPQSHKKKDGVLDSRIRHERSIVKQTSNIKEIKPNNGSKEESSSGLKIKSPASESNVTFVSGSEPVPVINIQGLNLDQLQEGEMLALQPQDALDLLKQHGKLNKDIIELLKQTGLEIPSDEGGGEGSLSENSSQMEVVLPLTEFMSDSFEEISCQDNENQPDLKFGIH